MSPFFKKENNLPGTFISIEVKFSSNPKPKHTAHLQTFLNEYDKKSSYGYLIFPGERPRKMAENIMALPWFNLYDIFKP